MSDSLFQEKVALLQLYYPSYEKAVLEDLLASCLGSVDETRSLISGVSVPKRPRGSLFQAPIVKEKRKFSPETTSNKKPRFRVVTLHTADQIRLHLHPYVSMYKNFLDKKDADELPRSLLRMMKGLEFRRFHLFENECVLNHTSKYFYREGNRHDYTYNGETHDPAGTTYDDLLERVSKKVDTFVNEKIRPTTTRLPFEQNVPWQANSCVVNYYEKLSNNLDWHSDRLNYMGPQNYICLVSLGATRYFRLRRTYGDTTIYQIPLPHNTLLVMHPGCQEEFKHCVNPMLKAEQLHPVLGAARYNITFRSHLAEFRGRLPKCKCGMLMMLRRSFKDPATRGKYFWTCENVYQNKDCGLYQWADFTKTPMVAPSEAEASVWLANDDTEARACQNVVKNESTSV